MTLLHQNPELTESAKSVVAQLSAREAIWKEQLKLQSVNDERKFKKARDTHAHQNRTLAHCKTWGGPCLSSAQLDAALLKADSEMFCVTQELVYYKLSHHTEYSSNRQPFELEALGTKIN